MNTLVFIGGPAAGQRLVGVSQPDWRMIITRSGRRYRVFGREGKTWFMVPA